MTRTKQRQYFFLLLPAKCRSPMNVPVHSLVVALRLLSKLLKSIMIYGLILKFIL